MICVWSLLKWMIFYSWWKLCACAKLIVHRMKFLIVWKNCLWIMLNFPMNLITKKMLIVNDALKYWNIQHNIYLYYINFPLFCSINYMENRYSWNIIIFLSLHPAFYKNKSLFMLNHLCVMSKNFLSPAR